jgi:methylmalonyl-CoA mutase C-terminal domain/subunit
LVGVFQLDSGSGLGLRGTNTSRHKHRFKVLVSKVGLDGHDRGAKVIAKALMEEGFEVVYMGVHQSVESIVKAAVEEDAKVVAISILSGAHLELARDLLAELRRAGAKCKVVMGGIIPEDDVPKLKRMGVYAVLGPGASLKEVISTIHSAAKESSEN